ncbi:hypothetical protein PUNSTDRAFT_134213 [Punctularia strigosozonata HHB-11173 SS5]|uniref:uncharacterized protein n=1 Tax=Punctularia strigosozonata (strain HHB-11173) TaxID=741275 RepID=UPI0004416991|nr:uncharacterized protein PUNSTDRAFT_134213 [Punctularia strigosozonata HHB-11173 SS5]EIN09039.1 hypothetical protein PUNSTDRAFT_134213 [Punctularia strigosozonata HHB-11173 SS5]
MVAYPDSPTPEFARIKGEIERLQFANMLLRDELSASKAEARAYKAEMAAQATTSPPADSDLITTLKARLSSLEAQATKDKSRIQALEAQATTDKSRVEALESQAARDAPFVAVGREVRLRYLEVHRQRRMRRRIGIEGEQRIKAGDRAAHRGRPVADAALCLPGVPDADANPSQLKETYEDLYGVGADEMRRRLQDVPEVVAAAGFHASLQSAGRKTTEFDKRFGEVMRLVGKHRDVVQLKIAFGENAALIRAHDDLQDCFDRIIATERLWQSPRPQS